MLQDELQTIAASLRPEDRDFVRALHEDDLIRLHRTLGRRLRNASRAGTYPHLFRYCNERETPETRSFDSLSETAIRLVWDYLRSTTGTPGAAG